MPSPSPTSAVDPPNRHAALLMLAAMARVFAHTVPGPGVDEDEDEDETPIGDPDEDDWEGEDWDEDDDEPIQVRPVRQIGPAKRL